MQDDDARSEATFRFTVHDFSNLENSVKSPPCYVRNLPWNIMVMPREAPSGGRHKGKSLGFYLQCNIESKSSSWSCFAQAELRLISHKPKTGPLLRKIQHLFYSKERDWGFSHFIAWSDVINPTNGYIKDDTITLEVHMVADPSHGVLFNFRKQTGYLGLGNEHAPPYMGSLLQTLYFNNPLRKAVYKIPTEADDGTRSVALILQQVFYELQTSEEPVNTKNPPNSTSSDMQEYLRFLLDELEIRMKGTCVEDTVPRLFEGKMQSCIKCKNVNVSSARVETFYDIQLNIKGKANIDESFKDYIGTQSLDGENKYDAGEYGLQKAEKRVIFSTFPPVLLLHLMRFQYDPNTISSVKYNDRFEFNEHMNLDAYLQQKTKTPADYTLHAVLTHSGDECDGRYLAFIDPKCDGNWSKFDKDVVSVCTKQDAIESNYGGALMLFYIRDSKLKTFLQEVTQADIPTELSERLAENMRIEKIRRKEREEAHLYMNVNVVVDEAFDGHQGNDLYDCERAHYRVFRVRKQASVADLLDLLADAFKYPPARLRPWPFITRTNQTCRPTCLDIVNDQHKTVADISENMNPWNIFLELLPPDSGLTALPTFDKENDVVLFFKYYDPKQKRIHYCGHHYLPIASKPADLIPILNKRAGLPLDTPLVLYEEISLNFIENINNHNGPLEKVLDELMDGDIIVFERADHRHEDLELPTCQDYFKYIFYKVEVQFMDKTVPNDPGFTMELSKQMRYGQLARAFGQRLDIDPYLIQFFKCNYDNTPDLALQYSYDGTLEDLLLHCAPAGPKKLFYQLLSASDNELDNEQFKCLLTFNGNSRVAGLLELPECPICLETMSAPIFLCQFGHSFCRECTNNLSPPLCPNCRKEMTQNRNWQLEEVIAKTRITCPNKSAGCKYILKPTNVQAHLKECIYRDKDCPIGSVFDKCSLNGN